MQGSFPIVFGRLLLGLLLLAPVGDHAYVGQSDDMADSLQDTGLYLTSEEYEEETFIRENLSYMNVFFAKLQLREVTLPQVSKRRLTEFKCIWSDFFAKPECLEPKSANQGKSRNSSCSIYEPDSDVDYFERSQRNGRRNASGPSTESEDNRWRQVNCSIKVCNFCGRFGHSTRVCRSLRGECFACGSGNHFLRQCHLYARAHRPSGGFVKFQPTVLAQDRQQLSIPSNVNHPVAANEKHYLRESTNSAVEQSPFLNKGIASTYENQTCSFDKSVPLKNRFGALSDECDIELVGKPFNGAANHAGVKRKRSFCGNSAMSRGSAPVELSHDDKSSLPEFCIPNEQPTVKSELEGGNNLDMQENNHSPEVSANVDSTSSDSGIVETPSTQCRIMQNWFTEEMQEKFKYLQSKLNYFEEKRQKKMRANDDEVIGKSFNWSFAESVNEDLSEPNHCEVISAPNDIISESPAVSELLNELKLPLESNSDYCESESSFLGWLKQVLRDLLEKLERVKTVSKLSDDSCSKNLADMLSTGTCNGLVSDFSRLEMLTDITDEFKQIIDGVEDFLANEKSLNCKGDTNSQLNDTSCGSIAKSTEYYDGLNGDEVQESISVQLDIDQYKSYLFL